MAAKSEAARHAPGMGVDNDSGNAEGMAENHVRRFSADASEAGKLDHRGGELSPMVLDQLLPAAFEGTGFGAKEPQAANDLFDFPRVGAGQRFRRREAREESGRDPVHRLVRALSRQDRRHQKLEGISVTKRNFDIRVSTGEPRRDLMGSALLLRDLFPSHARPETTNG